MRMSLLLLVGAAVATGAVVAAVVAKKVSFCHDESSKRPRLHISNRLLTSLLPFHHHSDKWLLPLIPLQGRLISV